MGSFARAMVEVDICESLELNCTIFNQQAILRACNVQIESEALEIKSLSLQKELNQKRENGRVTTRSLS